MQIDVQALGFELTPALREHTAAGSVCLRRRVGRSSPTDEPGVETPARRLDRGRIACGVRITLTGAPPSPVIDRSSDHPIL